MENMQRVRTACDRCQGSKVRCSRGKPACWRCYQNGQQCVYSPFRKIGRPSKQVASNSKSRADVHDDLEEAVQVGQQAIMGAYNTDWRDLNEETAQQIHDMGIDTDLNATTHLAFSDSSQRHMQPQPITMAHSFQRWPVMPTLAPEQLRHFHMNGSETQFNTVTTPSWEYSDRTETSPSNLSDSSDFSYSPQSSSIIQPQDGDWSTITYDGLRGRSKSAASSMSTPISTDLEAIDFAKHPLNGQSKLHAAANALSNSHSKSSHLQPILADSKSPDSEAKRRALYPTQQSNDAQCSSECYPALSKILARLTDWDAEREDIPLEPLLRLDEELQYTMKKVIACSCCCRGKSGNQAIIMLRILALDNLLRLFEKKQDRSQKPTVEAFLIGPASSPGSIQNFQEIFPWTEEPLLLGKYTVSDKVKATVLRQLVLAFVEKLVATLSDLEDEIDISLKDFNRRIAREMVEEISRRAAFIRGILRLASEPSVP